jgi:16S rRNA (cytosine1402-N4)-methyltransferase
MMENKTVYHNPVMLHECIEGLSIHPDGTYVDVTFGGGGHSKAIYSKLNSQGCLVAFDQDPEAKQNAWDAPNFYFVPSNFSFLKNQLKQLGINKVDGILADLGVSSHQFDADYRGFSIRHDAPLDMRMNTYAPVSALEVVNDYSETELTRVFRNYGELKNAFKIAGKIAQYRLTNRIETTVQLMDVVASCAPNLKQNKFYALLFQAIRMEVNKEVEVLSDFLMQSTDCLKPGGRLVVISYHSIEDRLVKNFMKRGSLNGEIKKDFFGNVLKPFTELNRHPIVPDIQEVDQNPRARSAKLRIAYRNE